MAAIVSGAYASWIINLLHIEPGRGATACQTQKLYCTVFAYLLIKVEHLVIFIWAVFESTQVVLQQAMT